MIAHPEFGPLAVAWLLRGFAETCKFTIMKAVMRNLADRPFQTFVRQTRAERKDQAISVTQVYNRAIKYFMMGARQPELAMRTLAQAAITENVKADRMIVAENALTQFKVRDFLVPVAPPLARVAPLYPWLMAVCCFDLF